MEIDFQKLSPMMRQYFEIKNTVDDALLLYRLGDFYEMFFDDALVGSRELDLTLTGRDCGLAERAPMCGVPFHSVNTYVSKLISKGYKVAICEQTEDPKSAKGLVKRDVSRIITPGTVTDGRMIPEEKNNYISCLYKRKGVFSVCFADISTGVMYVTEGLNSADDAISELMRFGPTELVFNTEAKEDERFGKYLSEVDSLCCDMLYDSFFDLEGAKSRIESQFSPEVQKQLIRLKSGLGVCCAGALLRYLANTQKTGVRRITQVNIYSPEQYMFLPVSTVRNLEIFETMRQHEKRGSLLWVLDKTSTGMGKRLLRNSLEQPLLDRAVIEKRLDAVEELYLNSSLLTKTTESLSGISDIERLYTKVIYKTVYPRELLGIAESCRKLEQLKAVASAYQSKLLAASCKSIDPLCDVRELIEKSIISDPPATTKDGGFIKPGFDAECDELRGIMTDGKGFLAGIESELKEKTGIRLLKIGYNRVFGYYIEVPKGSVSAAPDYFIRRQTLSTGERYITEELKQLEDKILGARERLTSREKFLYDELLNKLSERLGAVQTTASATAVIDMIASFAETALRNKYCRPTINTNGAIEIIAGRHPVVERMQKGQLFVPNNCLLDKDKNLVNIITGPNMAGKSTYMRQTALICIMAQIGSFIPAKSASLCLVDKVFTRVGASDDLFAGQSTFMVEMSEIAEILRDATNESLLILDEVGRGTSTFDGMSIAGSVLEYVCDTIRAKTMFATHFHELTEMESRYDCIRNYNISVKKRGDEISFLRRIVEGCADDSYGIQVAKLAGVPNTVIERAKELLTELEQKSRAGGFVRQVTVNEGNDSARRLYETVRGISVDTLTPIEAMCKLADLVTLASIGDNND